MITTPPELPPGSNCSTLGRGRFDLVVAGLLALVIFVVVYLPLGLKVVYSAAALENNLMFGGDSLRVIQDLAVFSAPHWRTVPHPNFLIIFNPLGVALAHFSSPQIATAILLACAGSLAVALMYLNLMAARLPRVTAALWAVLLGVSGTQVIFSVVPETYIFSSATLLFLALMLQTRAGHMRASVFGGVMAMSILITNVVPAAIMFWSSLKKQVSIPQAPMLRRCIIWAICLGVVMMSLNVLQRLIYSGAGLAFNPSSLYTETVRYSLMPNSDGLVDRINNLSQTLGLVNFIPPKPQTQSDNARYIVLRSDAIADMGTPLARSGVVFVLALWVGAIGAMVQQRLWRDPLVSAILLCIAFNFALHMIYGATEELYLYSCNWTGLVVLLLARSWRDWINTPYRAAALNTCLFGLVVICVDNSLDFMSACLRLWAPP